MDNKLLTRCDLVLMISGRRDSSTPKPCGNSVLADKYIDVMHRTIGIEMNEKDLNACARYNLGDLTLLFKHDPEMPRQDDISFNAFASLCYHEETKLCVLEIYIPDCNDGVQVLECERNDEMYVLSDGEYISEKEYLKKLAIIPHGLKRSVVFAYGDVPERDCVACLANEVSPFDGEVSGVLLDRVRNGNFFQYSGARCFASATTLLEIWSEDKYYELSERFELQTSEIYYIELILLRDASSQNIADRLAHLQREMKNMSIKEARLAIDKVDAAVANSVVLYDTSMIKWPTVIESVEILSKYFGVEQIDQRCTQNRRIAEKLLNDLERKENQASDNVTKFFLGVIAAVSTIGTIGSVVDAILDKDARFLISAVLFLLVYGLSELLKRALAKNNK